MKATGGGAYKYADVFKERLGVSLDKEDEMDCLVAGANFLLKVCHALYLLLLFASLFWHFRYFCDPMTRCRLF